jgi:putative endonuclease
MLRGAFIYILTDDDRTKLYIGVTYRLVREIIGHREKSNPRSYTARYKLFRLVYFEYFNRIEAAVKELESIRRGSREEKVARIEAMNPGWQDLFDFVRGEDFVFPAI